MKRTIIRFLIFGISIVLVSSLACADEVGRFSAIEGRVDILKQGVDKAMPAREGGAVSSGDIIRTKSLSKAEIRFTDKTVLKLAENTRVEIEDYTLNDFNLRANGVVNLQRGEIRAIVSKTIGATNFFVNTPNASGSVKGTDLFVFFQKSSTGILVNKGHFSVVNNGFPDQSIDVSGGFTSVVPPDQPPQEPRPYLDVEKSRHEIQTTVILPPAAEDPSQIRALVVKISGEVRVKRVGTRKWQALVANDVLGAGDQIETKESGKVELRLDNGNIITLKPNSTIILKKLMWDLKTGDYENLFEANFGNLRAKVEKLKGDSKFEIKTPTAVAAVRGTTMYLDILPGLTTAFYEGGTGSLTSVISKVSKVVGDGQTSSADSQGNVSDSADATDEQKSQWTAGWDPGETQGYSPPGGGTGDQSGYDGGEDGGGAPDTPDPGNGAPVDVPPEPDADGTSGGGAGNNLTGASDGEYYTSLERDVGSSIQATITSTDTSLSNPPDAEDPDDFAQATISGTYSNPNNSSIWLSDAGGGDATGGAYEGWMAGTWLSWEGMLNGLYIDSAGKAGIVGGNFSGTNTDTTFTGDGELNYQPIADTAIPPEQLGDSIVDSDPRPGRFWSILGDSEGTPGFIIGQEDRANKNITDEPWGIYSNIYNATYYNPDGDTEFTGVLQGYNDDGLFVSLLMGEDNSNGAIKMNLVGPYVTYDKEQIYTGAFLGAYTEGNSYDLEAVELGVFLEGERDEPFAFIGFWGQDIETINGDDVPPDGSLYHNDSGDISWAGEEVGVIGGGTSPWEGDAGLSALGYYYDWESEPYIWNTPMYSYNPQEDNYTTQDGGAFWGWTAGIWDDEDIDGYLVALYLAPTEAEGIYDAGFLTGEVEGEYSQALYMWGADGALTPELIASGLAIDPEVLNEGPYDGDIDEGRLSGDFDGVGSIEGEIAWGDTRSLYEEEDSWGIYDIKFGDENSYSNPDPDTYTTWQAVAGGGDEYDEYYDSFWFVDIEEGTWQNGHLTADVSGSLLSEDHIGTIEGKFFGVNDEHDGTWIGASIGTWRDEPLTFSGYWGEEEATLYYNDEGELGWAGEDYGLMGSTTPNWWDEESFSILAIGEYDDWESEPYIWNTLVYSYNTEEDNYTTQNGGAFWGWTAGIWDDEDMDGYAVALYLAPTETEGIYDAGFLTGDVEGEYSSALYMWTADGALTPELIESDVAIDPALLAEGPYEEDIRDDGRLSGDFNGVGNIEGEMAWGYTLSLDEDMDWGLYDIKFGDGNTYYNPDPATYTSWSGLAGGLEGDLDEEDEYYDSFWLVDIEEGTWEDGHITADVSGSLLSEDHIGTIEGKFFGVNDEHDGTWIGESIGTWTEESLTFSGYWGEEEATLYYNDEGELGWAGEDYGLMGSTTPDWWDEESFTIIAMGEYDGWESEPYIWNSPVYSYNPDEDNRTTQDGGAFWGYTGGLWSDDVMDGSLAALYLAPTDTEGIYDAGFLTGDVEGEYYPDISMWRAEATLTPTLMTSEESLDLDTEFIEDFVDWGGLEAEVEGFFGDWDGEIEGWSDWGETAFIHNGDESLDWGIYDIKFVGPDSYENPDGDTTWFTFIEGEGEFGYDEDGEGEWVGGMGGIWFDGKIRGSLSALYMTEEYSVGLIDGDVFGLYDELEDDYGTWVGESIGTFTEMGATHRRPDLDDFDLEGEAVAIFGDNGSLEDVSIEGVAIEISDQDWGVWAARFEAEYNNPGGLEDWTGDMAAYIDEELLFIGSVDGTDSIDEQILRLDILLYAFDEFFEPESLITFSGTAFGTYEPFASFYYEGVGTGSFREDPLTFSGLWGDEDFSLYFNDDGEISWASEDRGVIGSTSSNWWLDPSPFVAMGEYELDEVDEDKPLLWNTPIFSYNFDDEEYYTYDEGAFFGYTGGIWKDLTLDGALVAVYFDPEGYVGLLTGDAWGYYFPFFDETWFATGTLTPERMASVQDLDIDLDDDLEDYLYLGEMDGEVEGAFLNYGDIDTDGFDWEVQGLIDGLSAWGETAFIYDDEDESLPWGIYDLKLMGPDSYDKPVDSSDLWLAFIDGEGEFGYTGDGWYLGMAGGIWQDGEIDGALRALYVMDELPDMDSAGLIKGDVFGLYDEAGVDYGTWIGESIGIFTEMDTSEFYTGFNGLEFYGTGLGSFEGGGTLEDVFCYGFSLNLLDQNWGIWSAITEGNWSGPTSPWQLALGGAPYDDGDGIESWPGVWFGTINGTEWEDNILDGDFRGFWFTSIEDGNGGDIVAGKITGEVVGTYIDVPDGTDTWQSIGIGEWVEVTDLLSEGEGNLGFEMEELQDFVSVPITETYANLLTGVGGFDADGAMQGIMDLSIYNNEIWAALISGTYSDPTSNSWDLQLSDGPDVTNLTGDLWSDGEWHAAVDGVVNSSAIAGEAAGTYDDGNFEGLGAGTVE